VPGRNPDRIGGEMRITKSNQIGLGIDRIRDKSLFTGFPFENQGCIQGFYSIFAEFFRFAGSRGKKLDAFGIVE
jgi:hypothetical protein